MITVANRAPSDALPLEQQEAAMTGEGAPPAGQMPPSAPPARPAAEGAKRETLSLPQLERDAPVVRKPER